MSGHVCGGGRGGGERTSAKMPRLPPRVTGRMALAKKGNGIFGGFSITPSSYIELDEISASVCVCVCARLPRKHVVTHTHTLSKGELADRH